LAVVVQRYGADVTGGSESLARAVAERLALRHDVTVLTTCARDYVTWRNELPPGVESQGGVRVHRFQTEEERSLDRFNAYAEPLYGREHTHEEAVEFLRLQGPVVPGLVQHLAENRTQLDAVLFFTYLYYPTYWGLRAAHDHSILIPTAHDEPALRLDVFREVFALPRAFGFCSAPEERLVRSRFDLAGRPSAVTAIGVDTPNDPDVEGFRIRHDVRGPYLLYAGRIDAGKGCAEMVEHYFRYRQEVRGALPLLLIGKLAMREPSVPGVRHLGFLSEEDKYAAFAGAQAVICPSPYESLSIVLLEALSLGTPVLVSGRSPVLRDHAVRSGGGLYYETAEEFREGVDLVASLGQLRAAMGASGRRYVAEHYRWPAVMDRFETLIEAAAAPSGKRTQESQAKG
jgi:glycosyltransferase involved in cell wall biosynthesis